MCLFSNSPLHPVALSSKGLHCQWLVCLSLTASSNLFLPGQETEKQLQFLDVGVNVHSLVLKWLSCCNLRVENCSLDNISTSLAVVNYVCFKSSLILLNLLTDRLWA